MENLSVFKIKSVFVLAITAAVFVLTGCSDGGGSKSSKKTCPSTAYYDQYDGQWYVSYSDRKICNPMPGVQPQGCGYGEVIVRSPFQYDVNYDPRYMSDPRYTNQNYHFNNGTYQEVCMQPYGNAWSYVANAGGYYYVDLGLLNTSLYGNAGLSYSVGTPMVYYPQQNNTATTLLTLGVLAALFLL